jgi:hypothetical protein
MRLIRSVFRNWHEHGEKGEMLNWDPVADGAGAGDPAEASTHGIEVLNCNSSMCSKASFASQ